GRFRLVLDPGTSIDRRLRVPRPAERGPFRGTRSTARDKTDRSSDPPPPPAPFRADRMHRSGRRRGGLCDPGNGPCPATPCGPAPPRKSGTRGRSAAGPPVEPGTNGALPHAEYCPSHEGFPDGESPDETFSGPEVSAVRRP